MDNSWDTQMEKFEVPFCLLKFKKKSFLWNPLFHALVNYLKMPHFECKWNFFFESPWTYVSTMCVARGINSVWNNKKKTMKEE